MTVTERIAPTGTPFDEGYESHITFAADPDVSFWESIVGAPGFDGGDPVPTTTMFNASYRTKAPRKLTEMTPFQVQGKFSSETVDDMIALINQNGWITVQWPDGTRLSFVGFLKSFTPGQAQEGNPLLGTIEIVPTLQLLGVETDPEVIEQGTLP
jgi:hypothetical protein